MILLANGKVITRDPEGIGYLPDGGVVTDGGKIVEVGTTADLKAKYPQAEFVDARGGVIMPGLINAHTHIYSALARGLSIDGYNPTSFYEVLDGQWWYIDRNLDLEATRASAQALVIDSIKQGVTTIFDHHASLLRDPRLPDEDRRGRPRNSGCGPACATRSATGTGRRSPSSPCRRTRTSSTTASRTPSDMLKAMFGGHALFTISDKTFDRMVAANNGRVGYPHPRVRGHERRVRLPPELRPPARPAAPGPRHPGPQDHPGPLHPCEHRGNGYHQGHRTPCASTTPSPTWATPWASPRCCSSTRRAF